LNTFISLWLKFFFLLTPFFALSMFLSLTSACDADTRKRLALRIGVAASLLGLILYFAGGAIFALFGITVDAFRIGAGGLLFLSAVELVRGRLSAPVNEPESDIAVVPMAIPVLVGPATIGTLLVLGADFEEPLERITGALSLVLAVACVTALLWVAPWIDAILGKRNLAILSKITGLILAALAAQLILTGLQVLLVK
jgi:multiple antibiotic resistance protein